MTNQEEINLIILGFRETLTDAGRSAEYIQREVDAGLALVERPSVKNPHTGQETFVVDFDKAAQYLADIQASTEK